MNKTEVEQQVKSKGIAIAGGLALGCWDLTNIQWRGIETHFETHNEPLCRPRFSEYILNLNN